MVHGVTRNYEWKFFSPEQKNGQNIKTLEYCRIALGRPKQVILGLPAYLNM